MDPFFEHYGELELHRRMVSDQRRTDTFVAALQKVVTPDSVVLDVGTGTGILAMAAAQCGAKTVYAVDQSPIARVASKLIKENQLQERIRVFEGPAEALELPEKVDVIVSEWLGNLAYVENMLPAVLSCRDRYLKRDGIILPRTVSLFLAAVDDSVMYFGEGPGFWRRPSVLGLDLSFLEGEELKQGRAVQQTVEKSALLSEPIKFHQSDLREVSARPEQSDCKVEFVVERDGWMNGVCAWFSVEFAKGLTLDTGPFFPETHWAQTLLPMRPVCVRQGQSYSFDLSLGVDPDEPRHLCMSLEGDLFAARWLIE